MKNSATCSMAQHKLGALLALAFVLLATQYCSSPGTTSPDVVCVGVGCACIFAHDCPADMQCVNGMCSEEDPFPDGGSQDLVSGDGFTGDGLPFDGAFFDGGPAITDQAFAEACTDNLQCLSGWCLESPDGGYCTKVCSEGCPAGWACKSIAQTSPDFIEVCVLDKARLCLPCETDLHCGDAGDLCLSIGGGSFCGRDCAVEPCPTGYLCQDVEHNGSNYQQCLPSNGACDCGPENTGQVRGCEVTNAVGTCFGQETCAGETGWVGCTANPATAEVCDGVDNDCNGQFDEDMNPEPCLSENEFGSCSGTRTCQGPAGWVCSAKVPGEEICNGLDDECDGLVDEDFQDEEGHYLTVDNCGTCGNSCVAKFDGASAVDCQWIGGQATCVILECEPGYVLYNGVTCLDEDAFLCQPCSADGDCFGDFSSCVPVSDTDPRTFCTRSCAPDSPFSEICPPAYTCEEVDGGSYCMPENDSCDCGENNAGQTKACVIVNSFGSCFGTEECEPAVGWVGCTAVAPDAETCDGIDNDCDGMVDELTASGLPCSADNEFGSCPGTEVCDGEAGLVCSAATPLAEVCDSLDNNCNGEVDEGFAMQVGNPPMPKYGLLTEHCGACNYECPPVANGTASCDALPEFPSCAVGSCDDGYFDFLGVACLPVPQASLCTLCVDDSDCQGPTDRCIPDTQFQGYCGRDCAAGSIYGTAQTPCTGDAGTQDCCPSGFVCTASGEERQCLPISGSCSCVEEGVVGACKTENEWGTCVGLRTCELAGANPGWSACSAPVPATEACDGVDNDCDGLLDGLDDSLDLSTTPSGGGSCTNGIACDGNWFCQAGSWKCSAQNSTPEICDGLDNDCDGLPDDDFIINGLYQTIDHCGACGYDCAQLIPNSADQQCQLLAGSPTCVAQECEDGFFLFGGGAACIALPDNLCQPCSSDADCLVGSSKCIKAGVESFCARDCSAGSPYGNECPDGYVCSPQDGGQQCVPPSLSCTCGQDTLGLVRSCTVAECSGKQTCIATQTSYTFTECSTEGVVLEVCDGEDNDCDGQVDEGFLSNGIYVSDEHCGVCGNNCTVQVSLAIHHATGGCNAALDPPICVVDECSTEVEAGNTFEWVDINGILDDGCECRRVQGNITMDSPDTIFPADADDPPYPKADSIYSDANCDGIDGVIGNAIFVSAANPLPGDGSLDNPYQTLADALDAFAGSGKSYVLVAGGVYEENIVLSSGLRLHGGYAPDFLSRNIILFTTEIRGVPPGAGELPGTVSAVGLDNASAILSGFTVVGADRANGTAGQPGGSSFALYLLDSGEGVEIRNNWLIGGTGGAGGAGTQGSNGYGAQSPGGAALKGGNGANSGNCLNGNCNNISQAGGAGGSNPQCPGANGSAGGGVTCPQYNQPSYTPPDPAKDGTPGWTWTLDSGSSGSCGSHATEAGYPSAIKKLDGGDGHDADSAAAGNQGAGCTASLGQYANGQWAGLPGSLGKIGAAGNGGGAGGSSGGIDSASAQEMPPGVGAYSGNRYKLGATGGGAGAGGCGGAGGTGGAAGGGSVAAFVAYSAPGEALSAPILVGNLIQRGFGGPGGAGGYGGQGGLGGDGGVGGTSQSYWIDYKAGKGGRGGRGGEGGGGGGGCGGASLGVALFGGPADWQLDFGLANTFAQSEDVATGGSGGAAGASGQALPGAAGADGATQNIYIK
jgi:hypothetical protein